MTLECFPRRCPHPPLAPPPQQEERLRVREDQQPSGLPQPCQAEATAPATDTERIRTNIWVSKVGTVFFIMVNVFINGAQQKEFVKQSRDYMYYHAS